MRPAPLAIRKGVTNKEGKYVLSLKMASDAETV